MKRDIRNYEEIKHPFIPKFYGTIKYDNKDYPVIEFINGKTLFDYDFNFDFNETEMYEIILQMLLVINYLHNNHFIYRDLKPNNVIIDENKILVLIDFDRMVKENYTFDENAETADFTSFASPEINSNEMTNKCDIYSIGKIIFYMFEREFKQIKDDSDSENMLFLLFSGFLSIISFSLGSNPKAIAGRESVTKLTHNNCMGNRGVAQPKHIATNIVIISPILLDKRKCTAFLMLS